MFHRIVQEISGEHFGRPEYNPMVFEYENPNVTVCIRSEPKEEKGLVIIESSIRRSPNGKIKEIFERLAGGYYQDETKTAPLVESLKSLLKRDGDGSWGYTLPHDILPGYFHSFCDGVIKDLKSYCSRTYKTIRWLDGIEGPNHPFKNTKIQWSLDSSEWFNFPGKLYCEFGLKGGLYSSPKFIKKVTNIVQSGGSEPLYHELLREARSIKSLHSRSSLLIAVSATEAGVKQTITTLQPQTKWLIENAPSPDVIKLYRDYIHGKLLPDRKEIDIPKNTILEPLRKLIQMRNILAHGGSCNIDKNCLNDSLRVVENFLWILDYHQGNTWASKYIDEDVKDEMGI